MKPFARSIGPAIFLSIVCATLAACDQTNDEPVEAQEESKPAPEKVVINKDPYPSTYERLPSVTTAIVNGTILDGRGGRIDGGTVVMSDGRITAVGPDAEVPSDAVVIDAEDQWVTPGIIDVHSHLGVYPAPGVEAHSDGNEVTSPKTAKVWAEHSVWPHDPGFSRAIAGGVTALQILPGSANLFGGRSVTLKTVPSRTVQGMKFPGAPYGLKMACGENPKRVYGSKGQAPGSRMGNFAGYREAWAKAVEYKRSWDEYEKKIDAGEDTSPPPRDFEMDTLTAVLEGDIIVHMHCYRGDEMVQVIDMAKEFGYKVGTFHHGVEAYKVADHLAENDICAAVWADWWGFKMEAYDGIRENLALIHAAGACGMIHSDSSEDIQYLNQNVAKVLADARKAGLEITKEEAWLWLSYNPAVSLGIEEETGSLETGKAADVVLWTGDPFSVYTKAEKVFIDGALIWDVDDPEFQPVSDFELGQIGEGDVK